jgi:hypothetical protein
MYGPPRNARKKFVADKKNIDHGAPSMNQQRSQIRIPPFADAHERRLTTGGMLSGY